MINRFLTLLQEAFNMLLKTGQTTQYSSKEDDGYWQKGRDRAYLVLSTGQYSGTVDIVLNGKTHALSNNCVKDGVTGLMWARYVPGADIGPDNDGKLFWIDDTNDEDIFDFKDQANANSLGGHSDWRVPNYIELLSIVVLENNPAIDATAFPSTQAGYHWTASTRKASTTMGWVVSFAEGHFVNQHDKATAKNYCRLVRG